jgi:hypothetical protein
MKLNLNMRATPSAIAPPARSAKSPTNGRATRVAFFKLTTQIAPTTATGFKNSRAMR